MFIKIFVEHDVVMLPEVSSETEFWKLLPKSNF